MSFGKIVLDYGDSLIRESEMNILKTHQWLNDAIIGFYFEYLSNQAGEDGTFFFYQPSITQLLKLMPSVEELPCTLGGPLLLENLQYALWPINDSSETEKASSGSHWSLLVFSRPDNKFFHFDSYGGSNDPVSRKFSQRIAQFFSPTSNFQSFDGCCAQVNGRDCGLHVLVNAQLILEFVTSKRCGTTVFPHLARNGLSTATPKQAETKRTELLHLIESLSKNSK